MEDQQRHFWVDGFFSHGGVCERFLEVLVGEMIQVWQTYSSDGWWKPANQVIQSALFIP